MKSDRVLGVRPCSLRSTARNSDERTLSEKSKGLVPYVYRKR